MSKQYTYLRDIGLTVCLLVLCSVYCRAQDMSQVQIQTAQIAGGVYMLTGFGGNIAVSVGKDGILMIDDQYAPLTDKITTALAAISDQKVRFVINTHWHHDHTGGNENFAKAGAVLVAHENVRKRLSSEQFVALFDSKLPPAPEAALPLLTFTRDLTFHYNGDEIYMFHPGPAHTDGDTIVFFRKANVLHAGDIYFEGMYPYIGISSGGSIDSMIAATDQILTIVNSETRIIPGHGPVSYTKDFIAYRTMLTTIRDRILRHITQGHTLPETIAARPTRDFDEKWGGGLLKPDTFVELVYKSLVAKR